MNEENRTQTPQTEIKLMVDKGRGEETETHREREREREREKEPIPGKFYMSLGRSNQKVSALHLLIHYPEVQRSWAISDQ